MPTVDDNRSSWDSPDSWKRDGDEWSEAWGSSASLWFGTILPRIAPWLPARRLLEIAPGHGRVSQFLLGHCESFVGIDLAPTAVQHCRARFADVASATFEVTDGASLPGVADDSIDFAFSWDSLVHADLGVMAAYVAELARVLVPGGAAFLHHSTLGDFVSDGVLGIPNPHWRDPGVTAAGVRDLARAHGLACPSQELLSWGSPHRTDCFSVLRRPLGGAERTVETQVVTHPDMSAEMAHFRTVDALYRTPVERLRRGEIRGREPKRIGPRP